MTMNFSILSDWINPIYLEESYIRLLQQTLKAKPEVKYLVLDNFFKTEKLDELIRRHKNLNFSEKKDMYSHIDGSLLPYDGAVKFMDKSDYGFDFLFSKQWTNYLKRLVSFKYKDRTDTVVKLRYHKPHAKGFWIHTDSIQWKIVCICYFNKDWKVSDGGLLQLWRPDECTLETALKVSPSTDSKMEFLSENIRLNTAQVGGRFPDGDNRDNIDFVLIDQIIPAYNRVFICNTEKNYGYHSVTPSNERERTGFVQWIG
tara:strand:- start:79 stop:852 length:774 start_codon:yes stop_codon:yes gene_type:complete